MKISDKIANEMVSVTAPSKEYLRRILIIFMVLESAFHRPLFVVDEVVTTLSGGLIHQKDEEVRHDLSELLALLIFDEMAAVQEWYHCAVLCTNFTYLISVIRFVI